MATLINLGHTWGNQIRLRCPTCKVFVANKDAIECKCGVTYLRVEGTVYEVISV